MSGLQYATISLKLRQLNNLPIFLRGLQRFNSTSANKPYYVTTPIFYPNSVPHIGHLHSLVVADVFARYARISRPVQGVHFMTGTDEHGLKIQQAAKAKGFDPQSFCDQLSQHFRNLVSKANISHTRFSRTTERDHHEAVEYLWRELDTKGLIYKDMHEGWYSISDECFYTDTQVTHVTADGQDYHISTETGSKVEWTQEENYKFRLSAFRESLLEHFKNHPMAVYPEQFHAEVVATLSGTLADLSVSRPRSRLSWGIQVPNDPEHTIYVWIDALTVYLSATGYPWKSDKSVGKKAFWPPNLQIIGKDILRFHAIYFPAILQALGLPLTQQLLTHSHWTVDKRKMSKSVGNVADPLQAIDELGLDAVRYYLARVGGRFKDDVGAYQHSAKHASSQLTPPDCEAATLLKTLRDDDQGLARIVDRHMQNLELADALDRIMDTLSKVNTLLTNTAPWGRDVPAETVAETHAITLETLRICAILLQPVIPDKAGELLDALGIPKDQRMTEYAALGHGQVGAITPGVCLFTLPKTATRG
ncbi:hypothetical protein PHLGIDRAFT_73115 [Phlebiopsis gigantea 11061_1 CR5-6]|uniref:Probable methionine--tRNA ligase, mitochondrial n=1 Tax=Phlebiopsis gigantea (strain 11061_1 CR5-6) TaxID=745531 RepID=A0A0C3S9F3_PHLG1|nr:hypothetical protein PHLGIDRAFT_73115 [Phlebiopsis gigantea 11061_1 CR5-6]